MVDTLRRGQDQRGFTPIPKPSSFPSQGQGKYAGRTPIPFETDIYWTNQGDTQRSPTYASQDGTGGGSLPPPAGPTVSTFHRMRAQDSGVAPPGNYVYWTWEGEDPDWVGTGYSGGTPSPVGLMVPGSVKRLATWQE